MIEAQRRNQRPVSEAHIYNPCRRTLRWKIATAESIRAENAEIASRRKLSCVCDPFFGSPQNVRELHS